MKKVGLFILLGSIIFIGLLVYWTLSLRKHRVEVCMAYGGRTACRVAVGETEGQAINTAVQNACALIASGVTESISCQQSQPVSIKKL